MIAYNQHITYNESQTQYNGVIAVIFSVIDSVKSSDFFTSTKTLIISIIDNIVNSDAVSFGKLIVFNIIDSIKQLEGFFFISRQKGMSPVISSISKTKPSISSISNSKPITFK